MRTVITLLEALRAHRSTVARHWPEFRQLVERCRADLEENPAVSLIMSGDDEGEPDEEPPCPR